MLNLFRFLVLSCAVFPVIAQADPAPLTGIVQDPSGEPIEGARVVIWTGSAINDGPLLCPSCYADCGRSETTNQEGAFAFEDADDEVAFRLVIVAEGHHALHTRYVTPGQEPDSFTMYPRQKVTDPTRLVRGRVIDVDSRPVADAMIKPQMWWTKPGYEGGS